MPELSKERGNYSKPTEVTEEYHKVVKGLGHLTAASSAHRHLATASATAIACCSPRPNKSGSPARARKVQADYLQLQDF